MLFKKAQKVTKYFGHFWRTICHQELSKITQSGHTGVLSAAQEKIDKRISLVVVSFKNLTPAFLDKNVSEISPQQVSLIFLF